jgi:hypothetical protein
VWVRNTEDVHDKTNMFNTTKLWLKQTGLDNPDASCES